MKYYIIAGERSGDLHASNLMKAMLNLDSKVQFRYFGGDYMQAVGGELVVHYRQLAFMGVWEVLKNLRTITKYISFCKKDIERWKPDAIILVDYAGFNLKIAKWAKSNGMKVYYYISPKVWAWNQSRALKIKANVDKMFVILPFEVDFYKDYDWEVEYVGNPVVEAVEQHVVNNNFRLDNDLTEKPIIAVLPGSRAQEVKHILPILIGVFNQFPGYQFCVAGVSNLPKKAYELAELHSNSSIVFDQTYDLLAHSQAAIVCSGTATLETALWNVPQVVVYRTSQFSYLIGSKLVKVKYISLVNLIMDKEIVPELIQKDSTVEAIAANLQSAIQSDNLYDGLRAKLGTQSASKILAEALQLL